MTIASPNWRTMTRNGLALLECGKSWRPDSKDWRQRAELHISPGTPPQRGRTEAPPISIAQEPQV